MAASPALAGASITLNTSMIYLGRAIGTSLSGAVIAGSSYQHAAGGRRRCGTGSAGAVVAGRRRNR